MKKSIYWIVTLICFPVFILIKHYFYQPLDASDLFILFVNIVPDILTLSLFSVVLSLLVALIPMKKKKYGEKLLFVIPMCTVLFTALFSIALSSVKTVDYDSISIPAGLECSSIKNGTFETNLFIIERQDSIQIETEKLTKLQKKFKVRWLSDCEYEITPFSDESRHIYVKVVEVTATAYSCYVHSKAMRTIKYTLRKIKNN